MVFVFTNTECILATETYLVGVKEMYDNATTNVWSPVKTNDKLGVEVGVYESESSDSGHEPSGRTATLTAVEHPVGRRNFEDIGELERVTALRISRQMTEYMHCDFNGYKPVMPSVYKIPR